VISTLEHVQAVRDGIPESHEWDGRDLTLLALAERQARHIDALEAQVDESGVTDGDRVLPAVKEARTARLALAKLLGAVDMPESGREIQIRGRRGAAARWHKQVEAA
jgi:hypothetical protein